VQQAGVRLTQRPPGNGLGEMCRAGGVQRGEGKLGKQSGGPHPDQPAHQLRVGVGAVVAQRGGNEQRGTVGQAKAERDERQRLLVTPLHVVQHQQGRPADRKQRPREAFEEAVALPRIRHGPGPGPASPAALGRQQPADLGAPGGVEGRHRRLDGWGSQPVRHGRKRQPSRCPEALAARHHRALQQGLPGNLGHQAGLADTRTAPDQRHAPAADRSGPPQVVQQVKLPRPADELCRRQPGAAGRGRLLAHRLGAGHQPLERLPGRWIREDAQLTLQNRSAMMVGTHRTCPVAQIGLQPHQGPVANLLERLQGDPAAGNLHRPGQVAVPRSCRAEQVAQAHTLALNLRPDLEHPVVIHTGQEVTPVLRDGPGGMQEDPLVIADRFRRQGGFALDVKDAQVDPARRGVTPAQIRGGHHERRLVGQDLAQLVQFPAQVGQSLRVGRVRPEQAGDPLPGLGRPGVRGQEGDQGDRPRGVRATAGAGDGLLP